MPEESYDRDDSIDFNTGFRKNRETYRILSLDGGGVRGVMPATLLAEIEERTGRRIHELFNAAAGTSTGGILALGLTSKNPDENENIPVFRAGEMKQIYVDHAQHIFDYNYHSLYGFNSAQYHNDFLKRIGKQYLKNNTLLDSMIDVYITGYEIERCEPYGFYNRFATMNPKNNFYARDIMLATTAAPTYFPPVQIRNNPEAPKKERTIYSFVDGGVFANNPSMAALSHSYKQTGSTCNYEVISIGTGDSARPLHFKEANKYGYLGWVKKILGVFMDGQSKAVHEQIWQVLPDINNKQRYWRFQPQLDTDNEEMDNTDPKNINDLIYKAEKIIDSREFNKLIENLEDHPKADLSEFSD